MYVSDEKIDEAINVFKKHGGVLRTSEALKEGIYRRTLYFMQETGHITKMERGIYQLTDKGPLSNPDLTLVTTKIPKAIICLISALDFHEMTDEIPHKIHIALPRTSRDPALDYPPIEVYRFSGKSLSEGVEQHEIDGNKIQIYSPAKTIADCFKFRNKIGLNVAIEALERGIKERKASYKDIHEFAVICRVSNVIKPYLESIANG